MTKATHVFQLFPSLMSFDTNQVDASTSPKKNDHTNIGWFTNSHVISLANENTLIPIPASRKNKKLPLIFFQKVDHFPEKKSFRLSRLIL
mgnify:CR=1 FL=1